MTEMKILADYVKEWKPIATTLIGSPNDEVKMYGVRILQEVTKREDRLQKLRRELTDVLEYIDSESTPKLEVNLTPLMTASTSTEELIPLVTTSSSEELPSDVPCSCEVPIQEESIPIEDTAPCLVKETPSADAA